MEEAEWSPQLGRRVTLWNGSKVVRWAGLWTKQRKLVDLLVVF